MRSIILVMALGVFGCTKHNPDSCCSTQQQCDVLGIGAVTGCISGKTCDGTGTCVAVQCSTSADCTLPAQPICEDQLCVAKCTVDGQCSSDRPYCGTDGICDACLMDAQCTGNTSVCDGSTHTCRGCDEDFECPSGVCLDNEHLCAKDVAIVWVTESGTDVGTCTKDARCATFSFALSKTTTARNVIRVDGDTVDFGTTTNSLVAKTLYVDTGTIHLSRSGTVFDVGNSASLSLSGLLTVGDNAASAINVETGGVLHVSRVALGEATASTNGAIVVTGGVVTLDRVKFTATRNGNGNGISCFGGGVVTATSSTFTELAVVTSACELHLSGNSFQAQAGSLSVQGGTVTIENNVFATTYEYQDSAQVGSTAPGSYVRFNTWVDMSSNSLGGTGLTCIGTLDVSNNIFAFGPDGAYGCATSFSLFDVAQTSSSPGTGDLVGSSSTFFINEANGDFHLAVGSPAKGAGNPASTTTVDRDGNQRPNPAGTPPDIGAYEAP